MKLKKMIVIVLSTIISIVGIAGITASANTISSDYVTISYDKNHVSATSKALVSRYTVVSITVYDKNTGAYIDSSSNGCVLSFGGTISVNISGYSRKNYKIIVYCVCYAGRNPQTPVIWSYSYTID